MPNTSQRGGKKAKRGRKPKRNSRSRSRSRSSSLDLGSIISGKASGRRGKNTVLGDLMQLQSLMGNFPGMNPSLMGISPVPTGAATLSSASMVGLPNINSLSHLFNQSLGLSQNQSVPSASIPHMPNDNSSYGVPMGVSNNPVPSNFGLFGDRGIPPASDYIPSYGNSGLRIPLPDSDLDLAVAQAQAVYPLSAKQTRGMYPPPDSDLDLAAAQATATGSPYSSGPELEEIVIDDTPNAAAVKPQGLMINNSPAPQSTVDLGTKYPGLNLVG